MFEKEKCACCQQLTVDKDAKFDICPNCGWEKDATQNENPNYKGGANKMSLNEAREAYKKGLSIE